MHRVSPSRRLAAIAGALAGLTVAILIAANVGETPPPCVRYSDSLRGRRSFPAPPCPAIEDGLYDVTLQTSLGEIALTLDTRLDRETVNNFVFLARVGFYDGVTFHRVESTGDHAFVQTGDRTGTGTGTAGYTYDADPPSPIARYVRGMVAMAHPPGRLDLTSSQFFMIVKDWDAISGPEVTPEYPFFGYVANTDSEKVLDEIVSAPRDGTRPSPPIVVRRVTVRYRSFFEEPPR